MDDALELTKQLQDIQWQIAAFIDEHTANASDDELAQNLRRAFGALDAAKGVIIDRAMEAGAVTLYQHGKTPVDKLPDVNSIQDDVKTS